MSSNIDTPLLFGMKSRRRTEMMEIAREREAKKASLLEQCNVKASRPITVQCMAESRDDVEDTPFDELLPSVEDKAFDECSDDDCREPSTTTRETPRVSNVSAREQWPEEEPVKLRTRAKSTGRLTRSNHVPFDEIGRRDTKVASVNFSPLVNFRADQQRKEQRAFEKTEEFVNKALRSKSRSLSKQRQDERTHSMHKSNQHTPLRRRQEESRGEPDDLSKRVPRDEQGRRIRPRALLRVRRFQQQQFHQEEISTKRVETEEQRDAPPEQDESEMKVESSCHQVRELPSDEEVNGSDDDDDQTLPSIDGDTKSLGTGVANTTSSKGNEQTSDEDDGNNNLASSGNPTTDLATEVARFKLFREIIEQGGVQQKDESSIAQTCNSTACPSTDSVEQETKRGENDSKAPENDKFRRFALASSVSIFTSERIMKSIHSRSTQASSSIENVVVWSASRDVTLDQIGEEKPTPVSTMTSKLDSIHKSRQAVFRARAQPSENADDEPENSNSRNHRSSGMPSNEVMTLPINTTFSSLEGSVSTDETTRDQSVRQTNNRGTEKHSPDVLESSLPPRSPPIHAKPNWAFYKKQLSAFPTQPQTKRKIVPTVVEKCDTDRTQKVWSFYDPQEIEALSTKGSVVGLGNSPNNDNFADLSRNDDTTSEELPMDERAGENHTSGDEDAPIERIPSGMLSVASDIPSVATDFSFSHLMGSQEADGTDTGVDPSIHHSSTKSSGKMDMSRQPSDEKSSNAKGNCDKLRLPNESPRKWIIQPKDESLLSNGSSDSSADSSDDDVPSLSVDSGMAESMNSQASINSQASMMSEADVDVPNKEMLAKYRETSLLQEMSQHDDIHEPGSPTKRHTNNRSSNNNNKNNKVETSTWEQPIKPKRGANAYCADIVPDFAIDRVVGLMNHFNIEHAKNKYVCQERKSILHHFQYRPKELDVIDNSPKTSSKHSDTGRSETSTLDRYSSAEEIENYMKGPMGEQDDDIDSEAGMDEAKIVKSSKVKAIADRGREVFGVAMKNSLVPQQSEDELPDLSIKGGSYIVQIGSEKGSRSFTLNRSNTVQSSQHIKEPAVAGGSVKSEVIKAEAGAVLHMGSIGRSMETAGASDEQTERTSATANSSNGSASSRDESSGIVEQETHQSSTRSVPTLNLSYASTSRNDESFAYMDSLQKADSQRLLAQARAGLAVSRVAGIGPFSPLCGPATKEMLHLISAGNRPCQETVNDLVWSQGFFCKCAAVSFED